MRKPHRHQNASTGETWECTNGDCKLPFRAHVQVYAAPKRKRNYAAREKHATRKEQHAHLLECGYQNWDDRS